MRMCMFYGMFVNFISRGQLDISPMNLGFTWQNLWEHNRMPPPMMKKMTIASVAHFVLTITVIYVVVMVIM